MSRESRKWARKNRIARGGYRKEGDRGGCLFAFATLPIDVFRLIFDRITNA